MKKLIVKTIPSIPMPKSYLSFYDFDLTRKYPLRGYILDSGSPGGIFVTPKTCGTTFISNIL